MRTFFKSISTLPRNVFGVLFWNFLFAVWPFSIFIGLLAVTGVRPMMINNEPATGIEALLFTAAIAPAAALVVATSTWIFIMIGHLTLRIIVNLFGFDD